MTRREGLEVLRTAGTIDEHQVQQVKEFHGKKLKGIEETNVKKCLECLEMFAEIAEKKDDYKSCRGCLVSMTIPCAGSRLQHCIAARMRQIYFW